MFIPVQLTKAGVGISSSKEKGQFASPGLLSEMSSPPVVHGFHLLHITTPLG